MRSRIGSSSRKPEVSGKPVGVGNGAAVLTSTISTKIRKKWRFAPDAIGMVSGPRDLSQRKGLSA